jgi:chemotaxis protein CheD
MNELQKFEYLLEPGYMIVSTEPSIIYMVLGSSVSVICRDRKRNRSGCCHYAIPRPPRGAAPTPCHGSAAVLHLIRLLLEGNGRVGDLEAQVFGGGDLSSRTLGRENAEIALAVLRKKGVHVASIDVGGEKGRKIIYNTESNQVAVLKVDRIRESDWYPDEGAV